ncbi:hypothetical protein [uncultured Clostridium sp.]|uniref:hypothetical protein n=1 Tax=uncultured Clostridium sp. TaxID=59620 RepID=UPI0032175A5E
MLKTNKSITLTGYSIIENKQVAYMNATISTNGGNVGSVTRSIQNQELYNANKAEVRADMDNFDKELYAIEDELVGGATSEA